MRRSIRRLELKEGIHLEGVGIINCVIPMALKHVEMDMYYDTSYPSMVVVETLAATHFIPFANVKSGTFDGEPNGNVV